MREASRVPVCRACLAEPEPFLAECFCQSCRTPFANACALDERGVCGLCRRGLRGFDAAYCFGSYDGALRDLIHIYKYGRVKTLCRPLGALLAKGLPLDERFDVMTPAPLHWSKRWQRGFNQSELLARELRRRRGLTLVNALRRVRPTKAQAGLSNTARRRNVAGAFEIRERYAPLVQGKRVLVVDDVLTTGATGAACALALKRAGAARVAILTLARVDRRADGLGPPPRSHPLESST